WLALSFPTSIHCSRYPVCPFANHTTPSPPYTPSLHDALPISRRELTPAWQPVCAASVRPWCSTRSCGWRCSPGSRHEGSRRSTRDRKSTRLNSSHVKNSYAVFCLKKKNYSKDQMGVQLSIKAP